MILETAPEIKLRAIVEGVNLGDRCAEILASIVVFQKDKGYPPTIHELVMINGFTSPAPVQEHLGTLQQFGILDRERYGTRTMRVLKDIKLEIVHADRLGRFRRKALRPIVPVVKSPIVQRSSVPVRSLDW